MGSAPPPTALLLVSSVPFLLPEPKHLAEEGTMVWQSLPPALESLGHWHLRGSAEILESRPRLTPSVLSPGWEQGSPPGLEREPVRVEKG